MHWSGKYGKFASWWERLSRHGIQLDAPLLHGMMWRPGFFSLPPFAASLGKFLVRMTSVGESYPLVLAVLRDKLVDELLENICDLECRLKVAESLSSRQSQREIATGILSEGVRISDDE